MTKYIVLRLTEMEAGSLRIIAPPEDSWPSGKYGAALERVYEKIRAAEKKLAEEDERNAVPHKK